MKKKLNENNNFKKCGYITVYFYRDGQFAVQNKIVNKQTFFREKKIRIRGLSIEYRMSWSQYLCNLYKLCIQTAPIRNLDWFYFHNFPIKFCSGI